MDCAAGRGYIKITSRTERKREQGMGGDTYRRTQIAFDLTVLQTRT